GAPSSAGWNTNSTLPANWSRTPARASATPIRIAVCASWPQACITPTVSPRYSPVAFEAKGRSLRSVTGSASMSARSSTVGPGRPPSSSATTPVWATPVSGSRPSARRWAATFSAVRNSRLLSSGCWWMSRRQACTLASSGPASASGVSGCAVAVGATVSAAIAARVIQRFDMAARSPWVVLPQHNGRQRHRLPAAAPEHATWVRLAPPEADARTHTGSRPVRTREIRVRLHLDQPARRALELEPQPFAAVEHRRQRGRAGDQVDVAVVELVHQVDE